ncbi:hypothetical protein GCM10010869_10530 [Mesorhizobium tianshanense]|uniref:Uncharacterized protein n=1 Tax=Mesorhizobium tianshanense TaxID=39844 RepID=A0A562N489_9HYPH|nr:hypothetical protein [Mesorhizobium tianshanense]TWI26987.1 hypothetical protein IQ26_05683 [Mesorhizobium tianshanense]GLS35465.1 hypothetical protein GCM10010869_10530 [Mesorhizobium tianshanense]
MPTDIEKMSTEIASSTSFDGYSLWRMQKDVNNQIFALERNQFPVPIELARLRAIIAKAREFRQSRGRSREANTSTRPPEIVTAQAAKSFDVFDFVDHYRALGGLRLAVDIGLAIKVRQWNKDTPEAEDFWTRGWTALDPGRQSDIARALLVRGRY